MDEWFGGALQVRRGERLDVLALPGFVAEGDGGPAGIATYRLENGDCELAFIAAFERREGIGTALLGGSPSTARSTMTRTTQPRRITRTKTTKTMLQAPAAMTTTTKTSPKTTTSATQSRGVGPNRLVL
jgi:hypothetical protein